MIQNAAHLHLIVNHWPLFGVPLGAAVLAWGEWKGVADFKKLGFVLLILSAVMAGVAYKSGTYGEEVIEHMPGISEAMIEEHEEAAEPAGILCSITALMALAGLWYQYKKPAVPRALVIVTLLLSVATMGFLARAANLGGKIHHEEVRGGQVVNVEQIADADSD